MKTGIAMVRVSGKKIRSLREEQNLTQLYLATAVGVTTETISRWERQEAPTLKEENGLKLAEAFAVPLEDILAPVEEVLEPEPEPEQTLPALSKKRNSIISLAALVLAAAIVFFYFTFKGNEVVQLSAQRFMPAHSVAGHPFPVVIVVDFESGKNSSLLLKEHLPAGCRVVQSVPQAIVADSAFLKWIDTNGSGKRSFSYIANCAAEQGGQDSFSFEGSLLVRQTRKQEIVVNGRSRIRLSSFHWADSDKNNIIDDEELLAVYDDFGRVEGLNVDVEEVETIWMGSAYRWDAKQSSFEIVP
jgi:transcriptional regulator with XRE-family HTH domain